MSALGPTRREQVLASGITIRQDFRDAVRFVFFETGMEDHPYATHGGTAFIVTYRGRCYGLTAGHVRGDFEWAQLVITDTKIGKTKAPIRGVYYPSAPRDDSVGSDVLDVTLIEFVDFVTADTFKGTAYVIDPKTVVTSKPGQSLLIAGNLKDHTEIVDDIAPHFALLQFTDLGLAGGDPALRLAKAKYAEQYFDTLLGLSGAPVYNQPASALCGMAVRGAPVGDQWHMRYVDIFDIMQLLDAVYTGGRRRIIARCSRASRARRSRTCRSSACW